MGSEIIPTLLQSSAAVCVVFIFVDYLNKRSKREETLYDQYSKAINSYLKDSLIIRRDETKAKLELSRRLQEFSDTNKEVRRALEGMYEFNLQQRDIIRKYEEKENLRIVKN